MGEATTRMLKTQEKDPLLAPSQGKSEELWERKGLRPKQL